MVSASADVEPGNHAAAAGVGEGDVEGGPGRAVVRDAALEDDFAAFAGDADVDEPLGDVLAEAPHDVAGDLLVDPGMLGGGLRTARRSEEDEREEGTPGSSHDWLPPAGACGRRAPLPQLYPPR